MIRLYNCLLWLYRAVGALIVIALILILLAGIVLRELFGMPLVWANEIALTLFVWCVFIGAGISFAENAHIRFSILVDMLPLAGRRVIGLIVTYVGLILLIGFWATGLYLTWLYRDHRFTTISASASWEWAAVPAGMFMAVLGWIRYGKWAWGGAELREKPLTEVTGA